MKTYRHLYEQICTWDNLYTAYLKARKGKRRTPAIARFEYDQETELITLYQDLLAQTYQPGAYHSFYIHEPKRRLISAAPFRDRIVHHALCNLIEPIFERSFIHDSYANRVGKGTHRALDRAQQFSRRYRYMLQADVRQFFPSIDHALLRQTIAHKIADEQVMVLVDKIIASGQGILAEEYEMQWFAGDEITAQHRPRGLPIGNLTSQFWANVYMNPFDHFVQRELKCPAYVRYVDDFVLFADDKKTLWEWLAALQQQLVQRRLTIHTGAHPRPTSEGLPFLGFVVYPTHRLLKRRKVIHSRRRLRQRWLAYHRQELTYSAFHASVMGWVNHVRYGDSWGLRKAVLRQMVVKRNVP